MRLTSVSESEFEVSTESPFFDNLGYCLAFDYLDSSSSGKVPVFS